MPAAPPADASPADAEQSGILELGERAPGGLTLVVLRNPETGDRVLATMRWGLQGTEDDSKPVLYVRAETIASRGPIREALRRRCIVPMDSYVQQASPEGAAGCYHISLADGAQMAVAAIWQDTGEGPHFAIVTCRANEAVAVIHDRMPVILPPQAWPTWLTAGLVSPLEVWDLLKPCPSTILRIRRIPGTTRRRAAPTEVGQQLELIAPGASLVHPGRQPRRKRPERPARSARRALG
ncbi:SOS response-associated peptidase [Dankookia rubra]|uniref:Abasic site processing protein n=1 Tax=Dankookia rubra TaxID=1442381 RepID=A0A4V3A9J9_9PROT|nr:SOS response-associated peptidase family protein [Dankookia rubra]TDH59575.1 SOS response-associated peptidase [Dankookia rubra]